MPLFGRARPQLPTTSYGYTPPPQATAGGGWNCPSETCGEGGPQQIRRWPHRCPACGTPTDPVFDEPWAHQARGPYLESLLRRDPENSASNVFTASLVAWGIEEAILSGDLASVERLRRKAHAYIEREQASDPRFFIPGQVLGTVLWYAREANLLDLIAEELDWWAGRTRATADNVEVDNEQRSDGRQLLGAELGFLLHPQARRHPACGRIQARAQEHRRAFAGVLTLDIQQDLARLGW